MPMPHLQHFRQIRRHRIYIRCWTVTSLWKDISEYHYLSKKQQLPETYLFLLMVKSDLFYVTNVPRDTANGGKGKGRWKKDSLRNVGCTDARMHRHSGDFIRPMLCIALDRQKQQE